MVTREVPARSLSAAYGDLFQSVALSGPAGYAFCAPLGLRGGTISPVAAIRSTYPSAASRLTSSTSRPSASVSRMPYSGSAL